jgi:hypothetical protein
LNLDPPPHLIELGLGQELKGLMIYGLNPLRSCPRSKKGAWGE